MAHYKFLTLICVLIGGACGQMKWCYLADNPNWVWIRENPSQAFSVECTEQCLQKDEPIWGTEVYSYDSNLCRAAVHDGRLRLQHFKSNRIVHVQRFPDVYNYIGSFRYGVQSQSYGALRYKFGCFRFTSPRINEEILDLTLLSKPALYKNGETVTLQCHLGSGGDTREIELTFGVHAKSWHESNSPMSTKPFCNASLSVPRSRLDVGLFSSSQTGAFYCTYVNSIYSYIITIVMRKDAYFTPEFVTKTVSVGNKNVVLSVKTQLAMAKNPPFRWYKDGEFLPSAIGHQLLISEVHSGHGGVYTVRYTSPDARLDRSALFRLVVRVCPDKKFGSACGHRCPVCLNGGICHDITGDCVCPPGFNGFACEKACEPNYFGRDCSSSCSDSQAVDGCQGVLLCLPDPYGCNCAAGFSGLDCNSYCKSGRYGAGCTQICGRCFKNAPCDRFSGTCSHGCEPGWKGPRCSITLPQLRSGPWLLEATSNSLSIAWSAWDPAIDPGDGRAVAYFIQYKAKGKATWKQDSFPGHILHGSFNYTVTSLSPETDYQVRVLVVDQSGIVAKDGAPISNFSTVCEGPLEPPSNISTNGSQPQQLVITWKVPEWSTWRCREITYTIRYRKREKEEEQEAETDEKWRRVTDLDRPRHVIDSPPFTHWIFQVRTENLAGASNWSNKVEGVTGQGAPGLVTSLQIIENASRSVLISWRPPEYVNGVIAHYEIKIQSLELLSCSQKSILNQWTWQKRTVVHLNTSESSIRLFSLESHVRHNVSIRAWTSVPGKTLTHSMVTSQGIPSAPPRKLRVWYEKETELGFLWIAPPCQLLHGNMVAYLCVLEAIDSWASDMGERKYIVEHKETSVNGNITSDGLIWIKLLKPFTNYLFRVYAGTSVGFSSKSANLTVRTKPSVPPPPTNLTTYAKSWTWVSFLWSGPYPPYGEVETFHLFLEPCATNFGCNVTINPRDSLCQHPMRRRKYCFTFYDLTPNDTYSIWVTAKNKNVDGMSELSEQLVVETIEYIPGPPSFIQYKNVDLVTLWVKWGAPLTTEGAILYYRVNLSMINDVFMNSSQFETKQSFRIPWDKNDIRLVNLLPETRYKISVEAFTSAGYGDAVWVEAVTRMPRTLSGSLNSDASDQRYSNKNENRYQLHGKTEHIVKKDSDSIVIGIVGTAMSILILLCLIILILYLIKRKTRLRAQAQIPSGGLKSDGEFSNIHLNCHKINQEIHMKKICNNIINDTVM